MSIRYKCRMIRLTDGAVDPQHRFKNTTRGNQLSHPEALSGRSIPDGGSVENVPTSGLDNPE